MTPDHAFSFLPLDSQHPACSGIMQKSTVKKCKSKVQQKNKEVQIIKTVKNYKIV